MWEDFVLNLSFVSFCFVSFFPHTDVATFNHNYVMNLKLRVLKFSSILIFKISLMSNLSFSRVSNESLRCV